MAKNTSSKFIASLFRVFRIKSLSIYQLTIIVLVATAIFSVGLISASWAYMETREVQNKIKELRETEIENKQAELKAEVTRHIAYLKFMQKDTTHYSLEQIKAEALGYLESIRFGNDGYVFVNTYDGMALLFDGKKLEEPKSMLQLNYPNDLNFYDTEMELAMLPEGGSFQYSFKKMNDTIQYPKMSYIMGFDEWSWIIGAGDYLDNFEAEINLLEKELKSDLKHQIVSVIGGILPVLIILVFISAIIARSISTQFKKLVVMFKNASLNKDNKLPFDKIFINELKTIGYNIMHAEDALYEANTIINRSPAVAFLWKNEKGWPVEFVSENVKKLFGYSSNDFISGRIVYAETIHKDDIEYVTQEVTLHSKQVNKHSFIHDPYRIITKNGDVKWVTDTTYIRRDVSGKITQYEGIVNDITEQYEVQNALSESKEKFTKLFHTSPNVITISNIKDGTIIDINEKGLVELGYKRDEIIGKTSIELELISLESRNKILKLLKETGSYSNIELKVKQKSGEERYGLFSGQIISINGKSFIFQTIADISAIKQTEKALLESETKLKKINHEQGAINLLSSKINKSLDINEVIKTSVKLLKKTLKSDLAFIFQRDGDNLILKGVDSNKSKKILGDIPVHKVGECMCGLSVTLKKALYSKNIFKDLRCTWDECKEAGLKSFAALPLFSGEDVIGVIGLAKFEEHDFEKDSAFLETISATVSIGLANALLHTETKNAEEKISTQADEITSLYKKTIETQETERRHIALELHDHLGQNITGIQLKLKEMEGAVNKNESAEQSRLIKESLDLTDILDKLTHDMTYELRPPMLDELGLRSTLDWYLNNFEASMNIKCELNMPGLKRSYTADINTAVFRILQEMLNNVKKHSKASKVKIDIQDKNGNINLTIKDNGIGFDVDKVYESIYKTGRVGILGIRERVKMVGGQIKIESKPKTGTTTLITIPTK